MTTMLKEYERLRLNMKEWLEEKGISELERLNRADWVRDEALGIVAKEWKERLMEKLQIYWETVNEDSYRVWFHRSHMTTVTRAEMETLWKILPETGVKIYPERVKADDRV